MDQGNAQRDAIVEPPRLCPRCRAPLPAAAAPRNLATCAACAATTHFKFLVGHVKARGHVFRRARHPGKANFAVQHEEGDSFHRKTFRWHKLTRIIDRVRNRYYERIVDSETEVVIRHVDEPLSEHHPGRSSTEPEERKP